MERYLSNLFRNDFCLKYLKDILDKLLEEQITLINHFQN